MRSIFLVLSACGAVSHASECQASEETSLLQGRSLVRLTTDAKTSLKSSLAGGSDAKSLDARGLVKSLQNLAHKVGTISDEEVNQALAEAADALATLSPAIQEEVQALQNTVLHAAAAVQACHAESGIQQRAALWEAAEAQAAEVTTCEAELTTAVADEERICSAASIEDVQSECACNEARVRREDKEKLCEALTTAYENAYCEHNLQCNTYHGCHEGETEVYNQIRADVETAMGPIEQEYIAAEQSTCIMEIIQHSMMNGVPIDFAAVLACSNVDTSSLLMVYPDLPAAPGACPAATTGSPECGGAALLASGFYRMQQKETMLYVDAHTGGNDHNAVTRTSQDNPSQWWYLESVGALEDQVFTIQQVENWRYLDAHESASNDFRVVTRTDQDNDSQRWHFTGVATGTFTINQAVNMRFLDAHVGGNDGRLVTRDEQGNDSQQWVLTPLSSAEEQQARDSM